MTSSPKEISVTIQDVDRESMKYVRNDSDNPSWVAQERHLIIPASNLKLISGMQSTGTSMDIFVREIWVRLTHTEKIINKKIENSKRDR